MSSYFDYFRMNINNNGMQRESDQIKGTCYAMCPSVEVELREEANLIHVLEVIGSERKLVKCYCRSAADTHIAEPKLLRPYSVLMKTVQYLLLEVPKRTDVPQSVVYDFVNDRLRAVRQDMTIQRLPPEDCKLLLEPMVRFHTYYGYVLSDLPLKNFDPVLNHKYLLECTIMFLSSCEKVVPKPEIDAITAKLKYMDPNQMGCDRILVECLYILCNLDNVQPLYRYISLPKDIKSDPKMLLAYKIAIANLEGNFVRVCKLLDSLCPLTYCALFTYLPKLQRRALQVLSHAYHNKRLTVPSRVVARWLELPDARAAARVCAHYGLAVEPDAVRFDKTEFKADVGVHQLKAPDLQPKFNIHEIQDIYKYTSND